MTNTLLSKCTGATCIVKNNSRILFCLREDNGLWVLPGGHIEENETPDQTAIRELKEETGLVVKNVKLRAIWQLIILGKVRY